MNTEVTFRSTAFNCTEPRPHFINECCFGEDVCRWLIERLREQGATTANEPEQEDFGWYFTFEAGGALHCFVLGFQPEDPATGEQWVGSIERQVGFWKSIFGDRARDIKPEAFQSIDEALRSAEEISHVEWSDRGSRR